MAATFEVLSITRADINQIKYSDSYSTAVQYLTPTAGAVYLFFTNTQSSTFDPNDQIAVEAKSAYHNENKYCYSGYTISPY
ncbi:MAG: hypothetical protein LUC37_02565, partial [Prevotella sp.]|nr:hypothetical protein [Prevotella sp.]